MVTEGRHRTDPLKSKTSLTRASLKLSKSEEASQKPKKKLDRNKLNRCGCLRAHLQPHLKSKSLSSRLSVLGIRRRNLTQARMVKKTPVLCF